MFYVNGLFRCLMMGACIFALVACNDLTDDLRPSGKDERAAVTAGSVGNMPGQRAADFSISDSLGETFTLSNHLDGGSEPADIIVLYFTMWCSICLTHSDHIYGQTMPQFKDRGTVVYALVDYVSGSVAISRASEQANGYAGSDFVTLVDSDLALQNQFNGTMASVVVINSDRTILMNENYRTGEKLTSILDKHLP